MTLLSPDLLDRRALALLRPVDVYGQAAGGAVIVGGDGIRSVRRRDGSIAVLQAAGFEEYCASFLAPSSPAPGSRTIAIDLAPSTAELSPRRFSLKLPRDPDPAKATDEGSLFTAIALEMLPGPAARLSGSACALRVTVIRTGDGMLVENALVRAQAGDGQFSARGLTDARGEATLVFPTLPLAVPGAGAALLSEILARVVVTADPRTAKFNAPGALPGAARSAPPFADPDEIGAAAADFASGTDVAIGAGRDVALRVEWTNP